MGKPKQVRLGKVVKRRDENVENKFTLSIKQMGKLTGQQQRRLKADIEKVCQDFLESLYIRDEPQKMNTTS